MKLWLISQTTNIGYDTYDSAVVVAETEQEAKAIHPGGDLYDNKTWSATGDRDSKYGPWTSKANVQCKYLGVADASIKAGVICASFNAG